MASPHIRIFTSINAYHLPSWESAAFLLPSAMLPFDLCIGRKVGRDEGEMQKKSAAAAGRHFGGRRDWQSA